MGSCVSSCQWTVDGGEDIKYCRIGCPPVLLSLEVVGLRDCFGNVANKHGTEQECQKWRRWQGQRAA